MKRPCFVSAKINKDGIAELVDEDGEVFQLQMHPTSKWPILSRRVRSFELRRDEQVASVLDPSPRPFKPKLIS